MGKDRDVFTRKLLVNAGIKKDMRILDVGCGIGEVSLLLHELMGGTGEVVGIDINDNSIQMAKANLIEKNIQNISFMTASIEDINGELGLFDAIVGRRVLMYLKNPEDSIGILKPHLKPGGLMVFQESDAFGHDFSTEQLPKHSQVQKWIWDTILRENGNIHIGSELYSIFAKAGLKVTDLRAEAVLQTPETGSDLAWLVKMMMPRIIKAQIATEKEIAIDTLEISLQKEMEAANTCLIRDMTFGICAELI